LAFGSPAVSDTLEWIVGMNFKTTYGLFGALLALLVVAGVWFTTGPKPGTEGLLLPTAKALQLKAKDFDTLTIEIKKPKEEKFVFKRVDDKRWRLDQPVDVRADASAVDRVIDDLLSARREGKEDIPKNLSDLGLDAPSITLTLGRKDGRNFTVSLGNVTIGGFNSQVFALSSDRPKDPIPVKRGALSSLLKTDGNQGGSAGEFAKSISDFKSKELLLEGAGFNPAETVNAISLTDGKTHIVLRKQLDNSWKYDKPDNYGPAEARGETSATTTSDASAPNGVEPLLNALAALKPPTVDDVVEGTTDFAQYGLDPDKGQYTIDVTRKDDSKETLLIGKKDDATGKYFCRLAGEKSIAKVPGNLVEPIRKLLEHPGSLRDKQLLSFAPSGCDAIDIKLAGDDKVLELRKVGSPPTWKLFDADGSAQLANTRSVIDLLTALGGKIVKDFPELGATDATLGFDRPSAELTLYVGGIVPEEKKEESKEKEKAESTKSDKPKMKEPAARLIVGKRDKDLLYVRRIVKDKDGKETSADFAVSETLWAKATRGRMDYVDPTLPSFVTTDANKLTFNRGAESFTIEKPEKATGWIIRQPADRADRPADPAVVESILQELAGLNAMRLWSEKPSERELERYGLKNPKLKAVVTVKDGDKTVDREYLFGGETDDKTGLYAKQSQRDLVFIVSKGATSALESSDLQDPVVFRIDPNRVTSIKLTGWKDIVGQPTTRELERKGSGNWVLKDDDKIKLSAGQCESLLNALALVRADRFVVHKSGPKDEHKLTVPQGALEIAISVEGEPEPITLVVGAAAPPDQRQFFALSNKLPGDVFVIPKGIFEAIKAKPGFFAAE
jgi:hypothetical protein